MIKRIETATSRVVSRAWLSFTRYLCCPVEVGDGALVADRHGGGSCRVGLQNCCCGMSIWSSRAGSIACGWSVDASEDNCRSQHAAELNTAGPCGFNRLAAKFRPHAVFCAVCVEIRPQIYGHCGIKRSRSLWHLRSAGCRCGVQTILRSRTVLPALPSGATSSMRELDRPVISLVPRWKVR